MKIKIKRSFSMQQSIIRFVNPFVDAGIFANDFLDQLKNTGVIDEFKIQTNINTRTDEIELKIPMSLFDDWKSKENYVIDCVRRTYNLLRPIYQHRKALKSKEEIDLFNQMNVVNLNVYKRA